MTSDQPSAAKFLPSDHPQSFFGTPALIVRISAIGDTLIAARTQAHLHARGYAPILVTHKNNASLLGCMPLLQGACLISDNGLAFFWRKNSNDGLLETDEAQFILALQDQLQKPNSHQDPKCKRLAVLDLQNTTRSRRAIDELESRFHRAGLKFEKLKVAKLSLWRLLLVFMSFLAQRQWTGRKVPAWLQRRLKPVHRLQQELVEVLPQLPVAPLKPLPAVLTAPPSPFPRHGGHVVFMVGASLRLKSWPKENYRALQKMILERTSLSVVLCGGPEDVQVGQYLAFPTHERIFNTIGKNTLAETLGLIQTAAYVVTGDSFASHAADLLGTPASVLFGSTHPLLGFAPKGSHVNVHHTQLSCSPCSRHGQGECRYKNILCLSSIKPEEVFSKIEQILGESRQGADSLSQSPDS